MAETIIKLRRDTESNYSPIAASWKPAYGEVCFVDTTDGLKYKVGDGTKYLSELEYNPAYAEVISGYYMNGNFYKNSTYIEADKIAPVINKIYIDKNSGGTIYWYDGSAYTSVNANLPTASDVVAGIMKLYNSNGTATDGTMTLASISNGIDTIAFDVDSTDEECLVLNKPW